MGRLYRQLDLDDRCTIAGLHAAGRSLRQIASALDRPASTISRELKRNSGRQVGYKPAYADEQTKARRWSGSRLDRDTALRRCVLDRLRLGWSPAAVAGRLALDAGRRVICHESIYRFIYAQLRRTQDFGWRHYLPCAKSKRGWRGRKSGVPARHIKGRVPITQRPLDANDRAVAGHWEGDTMLFTTYGQLILAAHERTSRAMLITRQPGKAAAPVADQLLRWLTPLPPSLRQTITFDNGTEFAEHQRLHEQGMATYFCDVRSPWQKGGIENAIG